MQINSRNVLNKIEIKISFSEAFAETVSREAEASVLMRLSGFICVTTINLIKSDKKQCYNNWFATH